MITYIDKNNAAQYTALFRKAELALAIPEKTISTLEQYFYYLPDLMELKKEGSEYGEMLGRRYAMLPVDEEVFFIDANTRMITVPTSFKRNGIAVQGDEVAEIIYFKINRYFDFMDLNNTEIYIQYEDSKGNKDVCQEWVRDIESDPDFLIFGWALRDPITKHDGTLKFSVRFVNWDDEDGTVSYNFSTLEASASINKALNLTIDATRAETENEEVNEMIIKRLKRSLVVGADKANTPEYHLTLEDWVKLNEGQADYIYSVDLKEDGTYLFKVQAYSTDAGNIDYSWRNGDVVLPNTPLYEKVLPVYPEGYDPDTDGVIYPIAQAGHIYYKKSETGDSYSIDSALKPGDEITEDRYELYGSYVAEGAGKYRAVAINKLKYDEAAKSTQEITIPGPKPVGFNPNGGGEQILSSANDFRKSLTTSLVNTDTPEAKYSYLYQWYKDGLEDTNKIEGATGEIYEVVGNADPKANETEVQGKYYLKTTAVRNNATIDSTTNAFLVTYFAEPIKAVTLVDQDSVPITIKANGGDTLFAKPEFEKDYQLKGAEYGSFTYQWYTVEGDDNRRTELEGKTQDHLYLPPHDAEDSLVGYEVQCKIVNNYNGTQTEQYSPIISVNR